MRTAIAGIARTMMAGAYALCKLFPVKHGKVVVLSRLSDTPSLDISLLVDELETRAECTDIAVICSRVGAGLASKMRFAAALMCSLYHLATSQVCILDSYWPAASMLTHRDGLTIIQMWHALGKIKQSGWAAVGKSGGRSVQDAAAVGMHAHYDYVVAGAPAWNRFYCESFRIGPQQILNYGLPRMDYLRTHADANKARMLELYPELGDKPLVLYVPTFRRNSAGTAAACDVRALQNPAYNLVVKCHPNQLLDTHDVLTCPALTSTQLLNAADCVVTDYSSIALESAWIGAKTLFYLYDYEDYLEGTGINVDPAAVMPHCTFYAADDLVEGILGALSGSYAEDEFKAYRQRYVLPEDARPTRDIADFACKRMADARA